ncbi:MAG: hypothetical protein ABI343_15655, partial [Burkholderiaceae bacterium]
VFTAEIGSQICWRKSTPTGCLMWRTPLARELLLRCIGGDASSTPAPVLVGCFATPAMRRPLSICCA